MTTLLGAPVASPAPPTAAPRRRLPGLDGLRALAVIAVLAYHLFPTAAPGGFLGVDVFFVISGFLITHLLLAEHDRAGRIRLGRFWVRRARRLLPALAAVVLVCGSAAAVIGGDVLVGLGRQVAGAATFSSNWLAILDGDSYFAADAPDLFRNFWSLALEEQFYLVWPLMLLLLLVVRRPRVRTSAMVLLAATSATAMALAFRPGADASRAYYGTDTHSFGLALGAALALVLHGLAASGRAERRPPGAARAGQRRVSRIPRMLGAARPALGAAALVLLAAGVVGLHDDTAITYRGGLVVVSLLAAVTVWAASAEGSRLGRALDVAPLRMLGERSYGIYLWHWPVFLLVTAALGAGGPGGPRMHGLLIAVVTIALSLVLAALSYRYVEQPIRRRGLRASAHAAWTAVRTPGSNRRAVAVVVLAALCLVGTVAGLLTAPPETRAQALIEQGERAVQRQDAGPVSPLAPQGSGHRASPDATAGPGGSAGAGTEDGRRTGAGHPSPSTPPSARAVPAVPGARQGPAARVLPWRVPRAADGHRPLPDGTRITAVGDSVMLASAPELTSAFPGIAIDAKVSRQMSTAPGILAAQAKAGRLRPIIVVGLGTNGAIARSTLDDIVRIAGPERRVVFVDVQAPRSWEKQVNATLEAYVAAHPQRTGLAAWREGIAGHLDLLAPDRIHPGSAGGKIYVSAVDDALQAIVDRPSPGWYLRRPEAGPSCRHRASCP